MLFVSRDAVISETTYNTRTHNDTSSRATMRRVRGNTPVYLATNTSASSTICPSVLRRFLMRAYIIIESVREEASKSARRLEWST
ncbi:hypothetical protein PENTCL1PPCAC_14563, partial [Pristionchus entomophagus]